MARRLLVLGVALSLCLATLGGCGTRRRLPTKAPEDVVEDFLRASRDVCERFVRDKPGVEPDTIAPFQRYVIATMGPFLSHSADEAFRLSFQERLQTLSENQDLTPEDPIYEYVDAMARMEYEIVSHSITEDRATVLTELRLENSSGDLVRKERMEFQLVLENERWVVTFESFSGGVPLPEKAPE